MSRDILVVDDDDAVRKLVCRTMSDAGHRVCEAVSGEDALGRLAEREFDVVIADIVLPGMDGMDLLGRIREACRADVILITGYASENDYAAAVRKGAADFVLKPVKGEELLLRLDRVLEERDLRRSRDRMLGRLQQLVITDSLTGLYNSRHFHQQIEVEMQRSVRYGHPLSLLLLDVDHFKQVNDTHGHLVGDRVLANVGTVILECLRKPDSAYRYGGEEFTVILPETEPEEALLVADRIRTRLSGAPFRPEPTERVDLSVSIGVATLRPDDVVRTLLQRADDAMYRAKQAGRNRVVVAEP